MRGVSEGQFGVYKPFHIKDLWKISFSKMTDYLRSAASPEIALSGYCGRTLCKFRLRQGLCVLGPPISGQNGQAQG